MRRKKSWVKVVPHRVAGDFACLEGIRRKDASTREREGRGMGKRGWDRPNTEGGIRKDKYL